VGGKDLPGGHVKVVDSDIDGLTLHRPRLGHVRVCALVFKKNL
jgi:hypothetical protein